VFRGIAGIRLHENSFYLLWMILSSSFHDGRVVSLGILFTCTYGFELYNLCFVATRRVRCCWRSLP